MSKKRQIIIGKNFLLVIALIFAVFLIGNVSATIFTRTPNNMTSNSDPVPFSTSCIADSGSGIQCWEAYANPTNASSIWGTNIRNTNTDGVVILDLGSGNSGSFNSINFTNANPDSSFNVKSLTISGSNDNNSWTDLDLENNLQQTYILNWTFNNTNYYRYWKVNITDNYGE